jgi:cytochrome P450
MTLSLKESLASGQGDLLLVARQAIMRISALLLVGSRLTQEPRFIDDLLAFDDAILRLISSLFAERPIRQGLAARSRAVARIGAELRNRRAEPHAGEPRDVADALLAAHLPSGEPIPDAVIAMDLFSYLFATLANTPAAAAMCLLHILTAPALKQRILDEQEKCCRTHGDSLNLPALRDMALLNACYQETLRLCAPAMHVRMTLKPVQLGRYKVPARSMLAFSPYLLHRDPSVYTDPEIFDPDRFLNGPRKPAQGPSTSSYIPFGRGLHACVGRNLARQEILLFLARLLRNYAVELVPCKNPLAVHFATNGMAAPVGPRILRVEPRSGSPWGPA